MTAMSKVKVITFTSVCRNERLRPAVALRVQIGRECLDSVSTNRRDSVREGSCVAMLSSSNTGVLKTE